jgi:hypothetical protein
MQESVLETGFQSPKGGRLTGHFLFVHDLADRSDPLLICSEHSRVGCFHRPKMYPFRLGLNRGPYESWPEWEI